MTLLLVAVALLVLSAITSVAVARSRRWSTLLGAGGTVAASVVGLLPTLNVLRSGESEALRLPWDVPYGAFFVEVDVLSAFFLLPIFVVPALAAAYGTEYQRHAAPERSSGASWFFFNLLVASMVLVVLARNAVLFLVAWEVMALTSFFLVTFDDEEESVRNAGWTYLVASHLGAACLLALFVLLGHDSGSLDFDRFGSAGMPGVLFLIAVVGFGAKAGFVPVHVWLPEAHPAAPSHVSAVMSAVMIKMGIYGLVRVLTLLGPPAVWWGWALCAIGAVSGLGGILFALSQHDLKRLLAYSSIENVGIIALGLGIGVVGCSVDAPAAAVLGFGGALLHVVSHAVMKGLLFLGAGAMAQAAGTREIDRLGGLLTRMPRTGATFLVGAAAVAGLPPLAGFASELLIYVGAYHALTAASAGAAMPALCVIGALALVGGLAAACFTRAFGVVFLGEPRGSDGALAAEPGRAMLWPMYVLATGCVLMAALAPLAMSALAPFLVAATRMAPDVVHARVASAMTMSWSVNAAGVLLLGVVGALAAFRRALLSGRNTATTVTWDCGYAQPTARMQYTGSSFAQPLTELFEGVLRTRRRVVSPRGFFPREGELATDTPDLAREWLYAPVFGAIGRALERFRWVQHGRVHVYVLYIALTLLALLVWKVG